MGFESSLGEFREVGSRTESWGNGLISKCRPWRDPVKERNSITDVERGPPSWEDPHRVVDPQNQTRSNESQE